MALGNDVSSVWNFCTRFLDVILQGNQWFSLQARACSAGGVLDCNRLKPIPWWEGWEGGGGVSVGIFFCKI